MFLERSHRLIEVFTAQHVESQRRDCPVSRCPQPLSYVERDERFWCRAGRFSNRPDPRGRTRQDRRGTGVIPRLEGRRVGDPAIRWRVVLIDGLNGGEAANRNPRSWSPDGRAPPTRSSPGGRGRRSERADREPPSHSARWGPAHRHRRREAERSFADESRDERRGRCGRRSATCSRIRQDGLRFEQRAVQRRVDRRQLRRVDEAGLGRRDRLARRQGPEPQADVI